MSAYALLTDPAPVIVGWSLLALVVGVAIVCVIAAWGPKPKTLDELLAEDAAEGPDFDANVAARWQS